MKRFSLIVLIAVLSLAGCASFRASSETQSVPMLGGAPVVMEERSYEPMAPGAEPMMAADSAAYAGDTVVTQAADQQRLVIQNADMAIVVADPKARMAAIEAMAKRMGGYVVSSNLSQVWTNNNLRVPEGYIVVRVPADSLTEALDEIKADVVEVQYENRSGQDVTDAYVDLESRLRNLEVAEAQLVRIMENATETEDVLQVFNQLTSIRGQIEQVKGQMQYYEQSAALSSIKVRVIAEQTVQPIEIAGWKPQGVVRDAIQNLIYFLQDFVDFLIWFVLNTLPKLVLIFGPLGLIVWAIVRAVRKNRRPKVEKAPETPKK